MDIWIIFAVVIILAIILSIVSMYNNLASLRLGIKNAWAQIDIQLKRRFDLIQNIVETIKEYVNHESQTLEKLTELRTKYNQCNDIEEKSKLNADLNSSLKSIFVIVESYPDLKSNQNFLDLQNELSDSEDKIEYSRHFYNDTVNIYNTTLKKFPTNIIAGIFKFREEQFFSLDKTE